LHVRCGSDVGDGQPLYTIHAESPGELAYALDYARKQPDIIVIADP
jgi:thymidine phosphorylase